MGCFKKVASIALPILGTLAAPGIGTALGSTLGASTLAAIGGAAGGGAGGLINGGGLAGALKGAAEGGVGGYLSSGGLSDITNGLGITTNGISDLTPSWLGGTTSLSTPGSSFADTSPIASAARDAISGGTTSSVPSSNFLSGYLPSGGSSVAGGGTTGGFFNSVADSTLPVSIPTPDLSISAPNAFASNGVGSGLAGQFASGVASATPSTGASMFSTSNLIGGLGRAAIPYLMGNTNQKGYNTLQTAGNQQATNYQPFLTAGQGATKTLSDLYGINGTDAATAATQNWQNTPGYTFARDQGLQAIDAGAAAKGMLTSGNNLQAEQQYGTGLANQYYNQYLQGLQGQQNVGLQGASGVSNGQGNAATASAAGSGAKASQFNNMIASLTGSLFPQQGYNINGINLGYNNGQDALSGLLRYL